MGVNWAIAPPAVPTMTPFLWRGEATGTQLVVSGMHITGTQCQLHHPIARFNITLDILTIHHRPSVRLNITHTPPITLDILTIHHRPLVRLNITHTPPSPLTSSPSITVR